MLIDSTAARLRFARWSAICSVSFVYGAGATACRASTQTAAKGYPQSDLLLAPQAAKIHRGWIGLQLGAMDTHADTGVPVIAVVPDSPAHSAGISAGDRLLECNARRLVGTEDLVTRIRASAPGSVLRLQAMRAGVARSFNVAVEFSPDETSVLTRLFVGRAAPSLESLVAMGGHSTPNWSDLRGRVVVLDFWAPWCGVCHLVADDLNQWQQEFGSELQVIGIAAASPQEVAKFAPRFRMQYLVAADPGEVVSKAFSASAVPMVFVIDRSGVVRAVHLGYSSERMSAMKQLITQLVSQQ